MVRRVSWQSIRVSQPFSCGTTGIIPAKLRHPIVASGPPQSSFSYLTSSGSILPKKAATILEVLSQYCIRLLSRWYHDAPSAVRCSLDFGRTNLFWNLSGKFDESRLKYVARDRTEGGGS